MDGMLMNMQVERMCAHLVPLTVLTLAGTIFYALAKVIAKAIL